MKKRNFKIIVIIFIILFIIFFIFQKVQKWFYSDEIIIFNLYEEQSDSENKSYIFNVGFNKVQTKSIDLYDTLKEETLINEKIAPGVSGEFDIIINSLDSTSKIKYQIDFKSKNDKPKNLLFNIKEDEEKHKSLEDLQKKLVGVLDENSSKRITIQWSWQYENTIAENVQDTLDGQNIQTYNFDVNIIGEMI